jgi:hypothetical protein
MRLSEKENILAAIETSGMHIEFSDTPDERMPKNHPEYHLFGSIWGNENDLTNFWRAYQQITGEKTSLAD